MIKQSLASQIDQKEIAKGICRLMKTVEEHNKKISEYKSDSFNFDIEDLPNEVWKDIEGYDGKYQISNFGRVKSIKYYSTRWDCWVNKPIIMKPYITRYGYLRVDLWKDKQAKHFLIHRLVAKAFIPNPDNYPCINHKNEIKTDNKVENLEWCTHQYNTTYGTGRERTSEQLRKPVSQFDKEGNFIRSYSCAKEAGNDLNIDADTIKQAANQSHNSAGGYIWLHTTEDHKPGYKLPDDQLRPVKLQNTAISQFDLEGNYLQSYNSIKEAEESLNISHSAISSCINGFTKTASGFIWKHYQDIHVSGYKLPPEEIFYQNTRRPYGSKAIKISDKTTGELIKYCNSLEQASKFLEICPTSIKKIIKRNGVYRHYKLEYMTD